MDNHDFLKVISNSFKKFLETGSRSNEKLKILHSAIATDIVNRLGNGYSVHSLGIGKGQEMKVNGRYIDKTVDITIMKAGKPIAGVAVKFVMQNYSQNSNNYFENMLRETANIRCGKIPYFQIFIIPDKLPYYKKDGTFQKWETFTVHNSHKYKVLSQDNIETSIHTPTKTLLFVIKLPEPTKPILNKQEYKEYYTNLKCLNVETSQEVYGIFESAVIYNNYEDFANKVVHYIQFM